MTERLLREYVALIVEKIRTQKGQKGIMGSKFDLQKFKSINDFRAALAYANKFLEKLGEGSSRAAFLLSGKYVLKIALNEKGIAQNNSELDVYTNPKSKPIVAKVYAADDKNMWLISDLVKPLTKPGEFRSLSGTDWEDFIDTLADHLGKSGTKTTPPDEFTKSVIDSAVSNRLLYGDLEELGHWGKTPDGRVVLLDYGFTEDVWSTHYKKKKEPEPSIKSPASIASSGKTASPNAAADTDKVSPQDKTDKNSKDNQGTKRAQFAQTELAPKPKGQGPRNRDDEKTAAFKKKQVDGGTKPAKYDPDELKKTGR